MSGKPRRPAYFAVARGIGTHPMFNYGKPAYSWREAWEWLIEEAAYRPKGHRHVRGLFALERGELCATHREMATAWRWPRSNVSYFLKRLMAAGMIRAESRADSRGKRRRITICNYDRFQPGHKGVAQTFAQTDAQDEPELPGIIAKVAGQQEQPTQNHIDSERVGLQGLQGVKFGDNSSATQWKDKPPHGAKDRKTGKWQWFDHPSSEWTQAARLHTADKGTRIFPKSYRGGKGNWFKVRSDAEIKLLYGKICQQEGIARVTTTFPRLAKPNSG